VPENFRGDLPRIDVPVLVVQGSAARCSNPTFPARPRPWPGVPREGRPARRRTAAWFYGTQVRHEGPIQAGGVGKDVTFVDAGHDIDEFEATYRTKYR